MAHLAALPNHFMMEVVRAGREVCFTVDTRLEDGYIVLGDKPGLGWEFDEEKLAALEVDALTPGIFLGSWGRRREAGLFIVPPDEQDDLHRAPEAARRGWLVDARSSESQSPPSSPGHLPWQ